MYTSGATTLEMLRPMAIGEKSSIFWFALVVVTIASVPNMIDYVRPQLLPIHRSGDRGDRVAAVVLSFTPHPTLPKVWFGILRGMAVRTATVRVHLVSSQIECEGLQ